MRRIMYVENEDARVAYWTKIRRQPSLAGMTEYRARTGRLTSARR